MALAGTPWLDPRGAEVSFSLRERPAAISASGRINAIAIHPSAVQNRGDQLLARDSSDFGVRTDDRPERDGPKARTRR